MRPLQTTSLASARRIASNLIQAKPVIQSRAFAAQAQSLGAQSRLSRTARRLASFPGTPVERQQQKQAQQQCGRRTYSSEAASGELMKTCLHDLHVSHGAKMVPFAGFSMPVLYPDQSLTQSHLWTREHASIFDVSHMVQQTFVGPKAGLFLEKTTPCAARSMEIGTCQLSCLMLEETGGVVDDCMISRIGEEQWYVVTNAGRREEDGEFFTDAMVKEGLVAEGEEGGPMAMDGGVMWGLGSGMGMVALQGPEAKDVVSKCMELGEGQGEWKDFFFGRISFAKIDVGEGEGGKVGVLISRGGYTGEDGFEIGMIDPGMGEKVVNTLVKAGEGKVKLAGLGARDSLRLEAGMCLYGHDLDEETTPVEAALSWIIPKDRRSVEYDPKFPGRDRVLGQLKTKAKGGQGVDRRRIGLKVENGPPAREGAMIEQDGKTVGTVTSGMPSPSLGSNIAMGYIEDGLQKSGTEVEVVVRGRKRKATVTKMPFVESKYYRG
ncbi:uncharacterized protein MKZ38_009306 [Zalerion maritima]|uniref:Aminomethyltransferase n=1 Tax=Zalerion maritima TaxID=339359 RepID=A0AAD5WTK6_9PEZI|nr:uncharacterized protein MKZ38_009306 [Zalerion maritima]